MKVYRFQVGKNESAQTIYSFLLEKLKNDVSHSKVRTAIFAGAIQVNRKRIQKVNFKVMENDQVVFFYKEKKLNRNIKPLAPQDIIYLDKDIVVVNKPAGLPTQPTLDDTRENLFAQLKKILASEIKSKVKSPYIGMHHRLDADTSGLILFTTSKRANPSIAHQFLHKEIQKEYRVVCEIEPQFIENPFFKEDKFSSGFQWEENGAIARVAVKKNIYTVDEKKGKQATTEFVLLQRKQNKLLLAAFPKTGRSHQIRVHLKARHIPVLGDKIYHFRGKKSAGRLMLHSYCLRFLHPITKKPLEFFAKEKLFEII